MSAIPTQVRDYNYRQTANKIPKQNDLCLEALYSLGKADAEMIVAWIEAKYNKALPITSVRRSLTNLGQYVVPVGRKETNFGGMATTYALNKDGIDRQEKLPF